MDRILTDGEKFSIAYALKKQAARLDKKGDEMLSGNGSTPDGETSQMHEVWIREGKAYRDAASGHRNLADFILRNKVTVDCVVMIPEQL